MNKDGLQILLISLLGLTTAVFIYPFIHEMGHVLCSVLIGAEVHQVTILPVPSMLCNIGAISNSGRVLIGFGGMTLPLLVALIIPRRWFVLWYVRTLLLGMSMLAIGISIISLFFDVNPQDDMVRVLTFWRYGKPALLEILLFLLATVCILLFTDKPGRRICKYFEI